MLSRCASNWQLTDLAMRSQTVNENLRIAMTENFGLDIIDNIFSSGVKPLAVECKTLLKKLDIYEICPQMLTIMVDLFEIWEETNEEVKNAVLTIAEVVNHKFTIDNRLKSFTWRNLSHLVNAFSFLKEEYFPTSASVAIAEIILASPVSTFKTYQINWLSRLIYSFSKWSCTHEAPMFEKAAIHIANLIIAMKEEIIKEKGIDGFILCNFAIGFTAWKSNVNDHTFKSASFVIVEMTETNGIHVLEMLTIANSVFKWFRNVAYLRNNKYEHLLRNLFLKIVGIINSNNDLPIIDLRLDILAEGLKRYFYRDDEKSSFRKAVLFLAKNIIENFNVRFRLSLACFAKLADLFTAWRFGDDKNRTLRKAVESIGETIYILYEEGRNFLYTPGDLVSLVIHFSRLQEEMKGDSLVKGVIAIAKMIQNSRLVYFDPHIDSRLLKCMSVFRFVHDEEHTIKGTIIVIAEGLKLRFHNDRLQEYTIRNLSFLSLYFGFCRDYYGIVPEIDAIITIIALIIDEKPPYVLQEATDEVLANFAYSLVRPTEDNRSFWKKLSESIAEAIIYKYEVKKLTSHNVRFLAYIIITFSHWPLLGVIRRAILCIANIVINDFMKNKLRFYNRSVLCKFIEGFQKCDPKNYRHKNYSNYPIYTAKEKLLIAMRRYNRMK